MKYFTTHEKGFSIVELIVAIAILSIGIIGLYSAFFPVYKVTYSFSPRFTAAYLAQEGLEIVRNIRDNNFVSHAAWSNGLLACEAGCQADYKTATLASGSTALNLNSDGFYGYDAGTATKFTRQITIHSISSDVLKVTVLVSWTYQGQPSSFNASEYLYNWY